jgi:hypothetical protein
LIGPFLLDKIDEKLKRRVEHNVIFITPAFVETLYFQHSHFDLLLPNGPLTSARF